jgi:hypothetical protein
MGNNILTAVARNNPKEMRGFHPTLVESIMDDPNNFDELMELRELHGIYEAKYYHFYK